MFQLLLLCCITFAHTDNMIDIIIFNMPSVFMPSFSLIRCPILYPKLLQIPLLLPSILSLPLARGKLSANAEFYFCNLHPLRQPSVPLTPSLPYNPRFYCSQTVVKKQPLFVMRERRRWGGGLSERQSSRS